MLVSVANDVGHPSPLVTESATVRSADIWSGEDDGCTSIILPYLGPR